MSKAEMVKILGDESKELEENESWDICRALEQALEHVPDDKPKEDGFYAISYIDGQAIVRIRDGICSWLTTNLDTDMPVAEMTKKIEWSDRIEFPEEIT